MNPLLRAEPAKTNDYVRQLRDHDHACIIYDNDQDLLDVAATHLHQGHQDNAKCLYITADHPVGQVRTALQDGGIPVAEAEAKGDLAVLNKNQTYLRTGSFDPHEMVYFLEQVLREQNGRSLRAIGEMGWALSSELYLPKLILYESKVNEVFAKHKFTALCAYDRRRFPASVLNELVRVHPIVLYGQRAMRNIFYVPPSQYLSGQKDAAIFDRTLADLLVHNRLDPDLHPATHDATRHYDKVASLGRAA